MYLQRYKLSPVNNERLTTDTADCNILYLSYIVAILFESAVYYTYVHKNIGPEYM